MALFHSRRVTPEKVVIYLVGGFGIGTVIGYIFMATAHTVRALLPPPPPPPPPAVAPVCQPTCSNHRSLSSTTANFAAVSVSTRGMHNVRTQMLEIRADSHYGVEPVKGQGVAAVTLTFSYSQRTVHPCCCPCASWSIVGSIA